jgi:hypothetical protein
MQKSHESGVATHIDPESCGAARKSSVEALTGERDWGNPTVRDETGGRRKLTEARNEAPACSDEEPVTATPRCPPIQHLRSTLPGCGNPACPDPWRGL